MDNDKDLNDIFADYEAIRNEDRDEENENIEQAGSDGIESSQAVATAVKRRIIRNPRPKLNAERLCGARGIPALEKHFEDVSFKKGKGHEKENLDKLMCNLEHWAHRLFPSLKFSESLMHIEKLGKKKPVQVCVKKLRLGMPILSEDFVHGAEEDEDDVQRQAETEVDEPVETTFDLLMREHRETYPEDAAIVEDSTVTPSPPVTNPYDSLLSLPKPVTEVQELTEDQKQRIERNKMLAAERRKAKLDASRSVSTLVANQSISSPQEHFPSDIFPESEMVHDSHPQCTESIPPCNDDGVDVRNVESSAE